MVSRPVNVNRDDLAKFIKDPRTIRAFENLAENQDTSAETVAAITEAPIVGVSTSPVFTADRFLNGSADILLTDGGAKGPLTFGLTTTGVSAATYGSASSVIQIAVDNKGRLTLAAQYALVTDNVSEGSTNLYFTTARARSSLSAGSGIGYNSATGVISVSSTTVGGNLLNLANPSAITFLRINADNTASTLSASAFLTAIGAPPTTRTISAGTGLTGGGDLSANRTLSIATTGVTAASYGAATAIPVITLNAQGQVTAASTATIPTLASGTYTPTLTANLNISSSTAHVCMYSRVGNIVTVAGTLDVTPTTSGAITSIYVSLPIASNLGSNDDCQGTSNINLLPTGAGVVLGDAVGDRAQINFLAPVTGSIACSFIFAYRVI